MPMGTLWDNVTAVVSQAWIVCWVSPSPKHQLGQATLGWSWRRPSFSLIQSESIGFVIKLSLLITRPHPDSAEIVSISSASKNMQDLDIHPRGQTWMNCGQSTVGGYLLIQDAWCDFQESASSQHWALLSQIFNCSQPLQHAIAACIEHQQLKTPASASEIRLQIPFSFVAFLVSTESHGAMRRSVICILHTVCTRLRMMHCTAAWAQVATRKECLPSIVGPPRMRVLRPQPCISTGGLAIASLWERLLVCYGITEILQKWDHFSSRLCGNVAPKPSTILTHSRAIVAQLQTSLQNAS